ncbi:MAG: 3-hydroxyacyl-CoA dehydrogenase [Thiotrichales bacterium]|jgi:carnitine 3-dehydrogenase|nr:3-hydroxyacyl-CoA dehydrogenase [Thiotrichales bacterium]MBT3854298.1 3-hydroxyacyl-CoA dehydrogenase [Thiotrichales bacterium]MBT4654166.1 3-hydroxyacyl-CoA dehydrogenase [Thiotrichales bacterium]MBT5499585.1 3-hydroxyacyl-CoA dehydrogenase [Thiotrichales bacterium]MBT5984178.1 3-hydroxyacyl-CoA dehydrogenase [Thiotrichales bacterium]
MDNEIYLKREYKYFSKEDNLNEPLALYNAKVDPDWIDYNGHMSESFYLYAFGDASDALFQYIGIDNNYRMAGQSFYTVETHINYYLEASEGEPLKFLTQVLGLDSKRLHIFHQMFHGDTGDLLATTEQMLIHVDMKKAKASEIDHDVFSILEKVWDSHQKLPSPKQKGRVMEIKI